MVFDTAMSGKYLTLDSADILWNYNNLRGTERGNNYISTDDGTGMDKLILPDGYYTFDAIAKKLKERNITLTYDPNTLFSKVETKLPLRLWRLGRLLGFDEKTYHLNLKLTSYHSHYLHALVHTEIHYVSHANLPDIPCQRYRILSVNY